MKTITTQVWTRLVLGKETAKDLMTPDPVSLRDTATVQEAVVLLTDKGIGAAPVIDEAGHPVGVVSHSDILAHEREQFRLPASAYAGATTYPVTGSPDAGPVTGSTDPTRVRDLMTPAVFSVTPDTPASKVVEEMLALKVHRLFVLDSSRVLIGVITALDVLRHLHPDEA